ncbi:MAG: methyltransferase domain-containing protein [Chloroflexi bacterium]|nr:methyltransferase domain-containing protein [Chloroflexota bacterium]
MEREQYDLMFAQEERHWWYVGMRRISTALLERHRPRVDRVNGRPLDVLDAGCGSGGMTRYLQRFGRVTGIDLAPEAVGLARTRGLTRLARSSVGSIPFRDGSFDIVTSFDVLYHLNVDDDRGALSEIHRVLRPGGVALIRLPAFDWIRGAHDEVVHTRHRYTREELTRKLESVGFLVERSTYANFLLFPLAPIKRYLELRSDTHEATDLWRPPGPFNRVLADLLSLESLAAMTVGLPWGLSVFAVARRVDPLPSPAVAAPLVAGTAAT